MTARVCDRNKTTTITVWPTAMSHAMLSATLLHHALWLCCVGIPYRSCSVSSPLFLNSRKLLSLFLFFWNSLVFAFDKLSSRTSYGLPLVLSFRPPVFSAPSKPFGLTRVAMRATAAREWPQSYPGIPQTTC